MSESDHSPRTLIVEPDANLGCLWSRHLHRLGADVTLTSAAADAISALQQHAFDVILINLVLDSGSALAIADVASLRHPQANVVFVTSSQFFSDGSIFSFSGNARMMVRAETPPDDLAQIVLHYGRDVSPGRGASQSPARG